MGWGVFATFGKCLGGMEGGVRDPGGRSAVLLECEGGCQVTSEHPHPTLSSALPGRKDEKDFFLVTLAYTPPRPVLSPSPVQSLSEAQPGPGAALLGQSRAPGPFSSITDPGSSAMRHDGSLGPHKSRRGYKGPKMRCSRDQRAVGAPGL